MTKTLLLATVATIASTAAFAEVTSVGATYDFDYSQFDSDAGDLTLATGDLSGNFEYAIDAWTLGAQLNGYTLGFGSDGDIDETMTATALTVYGAYAVTNDWTVVAGIEGVDVEGENETFYRVGAEYALNNYTFGAGVYTYDAGSDDETVPYVFADYKDGGYAATFAIAQYDETVLVNVDSAFDMGAYAGGLELMYMDDDGDSIYTLTGFGDYALNDKYTIGLEAEYGEILDMASTSKIALVGGYDFTDTVSAKVSLGQARYEAGNDDVTAGTFGFMIDYEFGAPSVTTFDAVPSVTEYVGELALNLGAL